ncbi:MAG: TonB-dependent receptor [Comamonadaceae bacterium]
MKYRVCLICLLAWFEISAAQVPLVMSEDDFLTDMPIVLSVSRLPQRLDDTPGAVTIIDSDMIRLSGARDVADLLRLVPGFQTSTSFERIAPTASYHGGFGSLSNRMQVLIDGRSVYSPYFVGSVESGLQSVSLADIDRIEVLRGSNSAAYGARAFLGVINVVTRDPADTLGLQAGLAGGENGIRDGMARVGWGQADTNFRLTAERRADDGLIGSNGHNQISRVNFRVDLRSGARDEVQLRAGKLAIDAGKGGEGNGYDAQRETLFGSAFAQLDWRRSLGVDEDLAFSLSHSQESYSDSYPYSLIPLGINDNVDISADGRASNDTVSLQHMFRRGSALRVVWGGELRREQVTSKPIYNTDAALLTGFTRLFANAEWGLASELVLNAGAMAERSSVSGASFAPRLMLNWHFAEGQTVRGGVSRAFRPPSTFEQFGDVRYSYKGLPLLVTTLARGNIHAESILVQEFGYLGDFPKHAINLDVRVFNEQISGFIVHQQYALPGATLLLSTPWDYFNGQDFSIRGLEYQTKWRPWPGAQLIFNQAYARISSTDPGDALAAPRLASSITYFQKLPGGLDLSLMHQGNSTATLQGAGADSGGQVAMTRTDLRLAWPLRIGANRGEVALVVQNLGSPYADFAPAFQFQRRAFVTLRLEN